MGKEVKKNKDFKIVAIGKHMIDLLEKVGNKFEEEYGFTPTSKEITNVIAKRVVSNNLF